MSIIFHMHLQQLFLCINPGLNKIECIHLACLSKNLVTNKWEHFVHEVIYIPEEQYHKNWSAAKQSWVHNALTCSVVYLHSLLHPCFQCVERDAPTCEVWQTPISSNEHHLWLQ
jgi:hypothetical protein